MAAKEEDPKKIGLNIFQDYLCDDDGVAFLPAKQKSIKGDLKKRTRRWVGNERYLRVMVAIGEGHRTKLTKGSVGFAELESTLAKKLITYLNNGITLTKNIVTAEALRVAMVMGMVIKTDKKTFGGLFEYEGQNKLRQYLREYEYVHK